MMTLKTIIGSITSDGVDEDERLDEEDANEDEYDVHTPDIYSRSSVGWLTACALVSGKPTSHQFAMGSCFDFGIHGASTTDFNNSSSSRSFNDDVIASPPSSPSSSFTRLPPLSSSPPPPDDTSSTCKNRHEDHQRDLNEIVERAERSIALEKTYVYDVYEQIAPYFRESRNRTWPKINQFLLELEPGSLICDAGCGGGKYLDVNRDVFSFGLDRCQTLSQLAKERGHEVVTCDIMGLPFRDESFDAVISISVIHHLATTERRIEALKELSRVLRIGGRLVITVWAMEQRHRKFESQDVLVPWHKPVRMSSEDQTSIEKDVTSTTTNSDDDILNYHAYTSGSEPSVLSYPIRKRFKFRESWMSRQHFGNGGRVNRRSSSQSSSDLSSPNESCYSFLRRALQKLSWGSTDRFKSNTSDPSSLFNPGSNSLEQFGCLNNFGNECFNASMNNCPVENRNRLNAVLDKQDSLDSNENADDIPIELFDVDGSEQMYQVPAEANRMRQRRGTSSSDNNVTVTRRISQSFERTASLKETMLNRRRNKSLKARLKRSASTDSPNSHAVTSKSRSLSDLLSLFSATFLQYSKKSSQDTTSGSSSSFTKHSSNSSVDSRGSKSVPLSKSNIFTLAKVEEDNENYNPNNNPVVGGGEHNNKNDKLENVTASSSLTVSLSDDTTTALRRTIVSRKTRPRSLILNRERVLSTIPRTLSVEDYQNGNHILLDFDSDLRINDRAHHQQVDGASLPIGLCHEDNFQMKTKRDMSTQFDYWSPEGDGEDNLKHDDKKCKYLLLKLNKSRYAVDSQFIDKIIDKDHLFPSHSMPNLSHVCSTKNPRPDLKKRNSFVLLSSKTKYLMEMTASNPDESVNNNGHPLNIKGFRRLSQPCMRFGGSGREDICCKCGFEANEDQNGGSKRWASILRRHSSFSVMKQSCHQHQLIRHSYSSGDSKLADSGIIGINQHHQQPSSCHHSNGSSSRHGNNKVILKEDSLQSDTSVDSDDSVASVIAVRREPTDLSVKTSSPKRNSMMKSSSSKEGSDTSFDSEESCVSVIAMAKSQSTENVFQEEVDVKWDKYMDASESLAMDSIFYVNMLHHPEMESMLKENDYCWTTIYDSDIVGVASVEYHNLADNFSVAETCWLDSSSSCKSCDQEEDVLDRQLQLDMNFGADVHSTSCSNDQKTSSGRLFEAAVDVANSLQSAVTVAVVSNQKCVEDNNDNCDVDKGSNEDMVSSDALQMEETRMEDDNIEMTGSFATNNDMSMSLSREEADFCLNEGNERDSFEESQWRVREDVINGNVSQAHLQLFQKMLQNVNCATSVSKPNVKRRSVERRSHRRKSDSEANSDWRFLSSTTAGKPKAMSRGKSLEFYASNDQTVFHETTVVGSVEEEEPADVVTKSVESSDNFVAVKDVHLDGFSDQLLNRLKSQNGAQSGAWTVGKSEKDKAGMMADESSNKIQLQDTLSISTSEDSILSGSENCGSTSHHRYYHVFREGELDYLIENYVENLHIISSYYDHSNWCVVAEKVQVWKI